MSLNYYIYFPHQVITYFYYSIMTTQTHKLYHHSVVFPHNISQIWFNISAQNNNFIQKLYNTCQNIKLSVRQTPIKNLNIPTNSPCQLNVLWHHHDPFCMNHTQIGLFKQSHQKSLSHFLEGRDGHTLNCKSALMFWVISLTTL